MCFLENKWEESLLGTKMSRHDRDCVRLQYDVPRSRPSRHEEFRKATWRARRARHPTALRGLHRGRSRRR